MSKVTIPFAGSTLHLLGWDNPIQRTHNLQWNRIADSIENGVPKIHARGLQIIVQFHWQDIPLVLQVLRRAQLVYADRRLAYKTISRDIEKIENIIMAEAKLIENS